MINLLELAKKRYWVDEDKDNKNEKYDWGDGGDGTTDFERNLPDGTPGKGKFDIDCSHLLNNVLKEKYTIPYLATGRLKSSEAQKYFDKITTGIRPGDIILFNGHVGFVEEYAPNPQYPNDPTKASGKFFGSQTSTGPATAIFGPNEYWGKDQPVVTILRPKENFDHNFNRSSLITQVKEFLANAINSIVGPSWSWIPIVLDLDGDGVETTLTTDGAYFDHDGNGFAEQTGWTLPDDGLLAWDRNSDGRISDRKELFGNNALLKNNALATNGFQALAEWDDNLDGEIDVNDAVWTNLKIWQDYDEDGFSASDELWSPSDLGISSINTSYTNINYTDPQGNQHKQEGTFTWSDGTTGTAREVWFQNGKMYTIANEWLDVPEDIAALPDLQGYGNVYDLHQALVRDTSGQLKSVVEQFMAETDPNIRNTLMEQILFKWTGSDGIDPVSRGPNIDARKLAVLEKFFGEAFVEVK